MNIFMYFISASAEAEATKISSGPGCCWCYCKRRGHLRSPDVKEVPAPTRCHPTAAEQAVVHCESPSSDKKSPSDSIPGGGEKCIESPDRVHGSFKSAEKKTFTVVKKEQPEVKREPSESLKGSAKRRRLRRFCPPPRTTGRSTIRETVLAKGRNGGTDHRAATDDRDSGQLLLLVRTICWRRRMRASSWTRRGVLVDDAIRQSTGRSLEQILMDAQTTRDLGLVAEQSKSSYRMMFRPAPHSVKDVFGNVRKLSKAKVEDIALVLKTESVIQIVQLLLEDGVVHLVDKCSMMPGTPLKFMLAHPTKGVKEVLERFDGKDLSASGSTTEIGRFSTCWRTAA
ncbi:conserved hypothetical protein [Culex quinquefasciatus]|uniref:DNA ligase ATP-dependent N-terminal domain-containing protein n=1 Tax=Culex quinquefasciatus TaxID=7176 RepID=B0X806_CULQU|nr:conserved hypothetical protein [Culex quinquefasciatus]|eukprot:XP_001865778.1 conserved hypothetical protein [Culex quinquefasciatus]